VDGVRAAFLMAGNVRLEIIAPTVPTNGVARFLERRGEGLHHVCFEVDELRATLDRLAAAGVELIDPRPRRGALGPVAFIHPHSSNGVLVELIEVAGGPAWLDFGLSPPSAIGV
jgi:methylmalonyl-CoA/ethylmalonyl-CoA epimerase